MKRKPFINSASRMVSYIHETAAWAATAARVKKIVSTPPRLSKITKIQD